MVILSYYILDLKCISHIFRNNKKYIDYAIKYQNFALN